MLAIPIIELRDPDRTPQSGAGAAGETAPADDAVGLARQWTAVGFSRLHVSDLDAEAGRGDHRDAIRGILDATPIAVQVGGGMREDEEIQASLGDGARWVVVGARGVEDPTWLAERAVLAPGRLILEIDVRGSRVVTRAWGTSTTRTIFDLVSDLEGIPLAGVLATAALADGRKRAAHHALFDDLCAIAPWPVIARGRTDSMLDLRNLEDRGVSAVVLDLEFLSGTLDPRVVAEEFGS